MYLRRIDPSVLVFSLSLYRQPFIYILFRSHFTCYNKNKIRNYRQIYLDRPDPITFMSISVDTSCRVYADFNRLLFLYTHREGSVLTNELPEEWDQFRFLRPTCLDNLKGSVELILTKTSDMRISIPFDLSSHPFIIIPLP